MKKILIFSVFMALFTVAHAQEIKFNKTVHDFGQIQEMDGLATTTFEFTNTGTAALVLNGVNASCGCTTPEWTKEPIAPNGTGYIKVSYNPRNRPGNFSKSVTVRSNAATATVVLNIKGNVIPRPKTVEEEYPVKMGDIRVRTKATPLFDLYKEDSRVNRIKIKNTSDKSQTLSFTDVPAHIVLEASPRTLSAQQEGEIIVTYNAKNIDDFGNRTDYAYVVLNNQPKQTDEYKITINSNLKEDFRKQTAEQKENAPVASFAENSITVELKAGEKKHITIDLTNTGKSNLIVRKPKVETGIAKASLKPTIAKGKKTPLKLDIDATGITTDKTAKVTIITNDPKNPVTIISVNIKISQS